MILKAEWYRPPPRCSYHPSRRGIPLIDAGLLGVLLGAGVCSNSNVTSRTGTTIEKYILQRSKNTFYMESLPAPSSGFSTCGGLEFHLGLDLVSDPYAETSRVVYRSSTRPGNLEQPERNSTNSIGHGLDCLFKKAHIRLGEPIFSLEAGVKAAPSVFRSGRRAPRSLRRTSACGPSL